MKRIVECLLEEGIDESMIHRVLDLIEEEYEVVNEVSVGLLSRAANSSLKGREENAEKANNDYEKSAAEYEEESRRYPEDEPALWRKLERDGEAAGKEQEREHHARRLSNLLPTGSKVSANKLFNAAYKRTEGKDYTRPETAKERYARVFYNNDDPVKDRWYYSYKRQKKNS